jgi:hypothetical protein
VHNPYIKSVVLLGLFFTLSVAFADGPSPDGWQKLFDLSAERNKLALERELIEKRLAKIDKRLAGLENVEFAQFERVANPTASDYWESISDTVLLANASRDIVKGELLVYHAPGDSQTSNHLQTVGNDDRSDEAG